MDQPIQYFAIGELIFSSPSDILTVLRSDEIAEIQNRFQKILKSFTTEETHYATNFIKGTSTRLPYSSLTPIGMLKDHLVLHFAFSYRNPVLFIVNTKDNCARNYIDIEVAKSILDDETYDDIKDELHYPRNLNRLFKGISDINAFVERFQKALEEHNNPERVTGRDCFEIELE